MSRVLSPNVVELGELPSCVHSHFNIAKLKRANEDPVTGQQFQDAQPPSITVEGEEEYRLMEIDAARTYKRGRGVFRQVRRWWEGYMDPIWEPSE